MRRRPARRLSPGELRLWCTHAREPEAALWVEPRAGDPRLERASARMCRGLLLLPNGRPRHQAGRRHGHLRLQRPASPRWRRRPGIGFAWPQTGLLGVLDAMRKLALGLAPTGLRPRQRDIDLTQVHAQVLACSASTGSGGRVAEEGGCPMVCSTVHGPMVARAALKAFRCAGRSAVACAGWEVQPSLWAAAPRGPLFMGRLHITGFGCIRRVAGEGHHGPGGAF
mmetsp:Transcript_71966/g.227494  ORF Transcript_71966/g.227494 Transcript_71966/m.227494 type:complete len:225 (+) Transcript_71966:1496-2170(+)